MIVSGPHRKKLCLKLTSTKDNDRTDLTASDSECPELEHVEIGNEKHRTRKSEKLNGAFALTRQSKSIDFFREAINSSTNEAQRRAFISQALISRAFISRAFISQSFISRAFIS
jgi:hypothetical protein